MTARRRAGRFALATALAAVVAVLAACSGGTTATDDASSDAPSDTASDTTTEQPDTNLDTSSIPGIDMVPEAARVNYLGSDNFVKLQANPYADWTAPDGPWTFCLSESYTGNSWRQTHMTELQGLVDGLVADGIATGPMTVTDSNGDTALQVSQFTSLVDDGCDVIVVLPGSPEAMCDTITSAHDEGVLVLTSDAAADCSDVVNVSFNGYYSMYLGATAVAEELGGEGNLLLVTGVQGVTANSAEQAAIDKVVADNPGLEVVGSVAGNWTPSVAQTEVAKFLATHPGQIDGVLEFGEMDVAAARAFEQAGREVPVMAATSGEAAALALWKENPGKIVDAQLQAPDGAAYETIHVALRMLNGQVPAVNTLLYPIPQVLEANFDEYYDSAFTTSTTGYPPSPDGKSVEDAYWDPFFTGGTPIG